jgi:hypothetical protein
MRHCEEIEKAQNLPDSTGFCLRMTGVQLAPFNLTMEIITCQRGRSRGITSSSFSWIEIILERTVGWEGLYLERSVWKLTREDWVVSKRFNSYGWLKLSVYSFQPHKSPGMDGIFPIMLQQGLKLLGSKLLMLLITSLALGYIPIRWRHVRVVFIPKPGTFLSQVKSFRPTSLSFVLKSLDKLVF